VYSAWISDKFVQGLNYCIAAPPDPAMIIGARANCNYGNPT